MGSMNSPTFCVDYFYVFDNLVFLCLVVTGTVCILCERPSHLRIQSLYGSIFLSIEQLTLAISWTLFRWWSHLHMRLCVFVGLYICGRKNWFRDYNLKSPNLCLGKSITVLLLGIAATNYVTKMKTTEHA